MTRRARTRLAKNIYQDNHGIAAVARAGGLTRELRFPASTTLETVQAAVERARADLREDAARDGGKQPRESLAREVDAYLKTRKGRAGMKADRSHLRAWVTLYPHELRHRIGTAQIERAMATWLEQGVAPKTIRHRCRALRELMQWATRKRATPFDDVALPHAPRPAPRAVPRTTVERVRKRLASGDPKDYARFLVRWTTGQRPSEIMRAQPADVDLRRRVWWVRAGKGGDPHPLALTAGAVKAWRFFMQAQAWGKFDTSDHAKALREAGWPVGVRPYELRHTLAIQVLEEDGDLGDVQAALGHRSIQTTRMFYGAVQLKRTKRVAAKLGRLHRW